MKREDMTPEEWRRVGPKTVAEGLRLAVPMAISDHYTARSRKTGDLLHIEHPVVGVLVRLSEYALALHLAPDAERLLEVAGPTGEPVPVTYEERPFVGQRNGWDLGIMCVADVGGGAWRRTRGRWVRLQRSAHNGESDDGDGAAGT